MFQIPRENIKDNIIKFADAEFKNLIARYGNINTLCVIRKILNCDLTAFTPEQLAVSGNLIRAYLDPGQYLLPATTRENLFWSAKYASAILALQLLKRAQGLYYVCLKHGLEKELSWLPGWTKQKAESIEKLVIGEEKLPNNQIKKMAFCYAAILLALYFYGDESIQKALPRIAGMLLSLLVMQAVMHTCTDYIGNRVLSHFHKKQQKEKYGDAYQQVIALLNEVTTKNYAIANLSDDDLEPSVIEHLIYKHRF